MGNEEYHGIDDPKNNDLPGKGGTTRRQFLLRTTLAGLGLTFTPYFLGASPAMPENDVETLPAPVTEVSFTVNNKKHSLKIDPRTSLLDALRENLMLTGTKKGCDHGQCGACTVLVNGRRINSCLSLAVSHEGDEITTIEGIASNGNLHPVQEAFMEHDGFQCGYCTSGQICSAVALQGEIQ